jgi:hypothetical protein
MHKQPAHQAQPENVSTSGEDAPPSQESDPGDRRASGDRRYCYDRRDLIRFDADRRDLFDRRDDGEISVPAIDD